MRCSVNMYRTTFRSVYREYHASALSSHVRGKYAWLRKYSVASDWLWVEIHMSTANRDNARRSTWKLGSIVRRESTVNKPHWVVRKWEMNAVPSNEYCFLEGNVSVYGISNSPVSGDANHSWNSRCDWKMLGMRKCIKDHNSIREFWSGVPVRRSLRWLLKVSSVCQRWDLKFLIFWAWRKKNSFLTSSISWQAL